MVIVVYARQGRRIAHVRHRKARKEEWLTPLKMIGRHHMFVGVSSAPAIGVPAAGRERGRDTVKTRIKKRARPAGSARLVRQCRV